METKKRGRGRPNKYNEYVKPHLKEIEEMCLEMTEKQIATSLGVAYSSWCQYKLDYPELAETIKKGRTNLVSELKSALIQKAKGYVYEEKKTVKREKDGVPVEYTEVYERYAHPDTGAIHLLLKNLDKTWRNDDHETMELKRKQVELTERKVENEEW